MLASSTSGDHHFCEIVTLFKPPPIRIGDERERLVIVSPVMTKSRAPAGENNYPENGLVKPPRRNTRALSPAGIFGGKVPLRLAHRRADRTRHQCPCAVRLLTFFANGEDKLDKSLGPLVCGANGATFTMKMNSNDKFCVTLLLTSNILMY
jgi:hypothetical protein